MPAHRDRIGGSSPTPGRLFRGKCTGYASNAKHAGRLELFAYSNHLEARCDQLNESRHAATTWHDVPNISDERLAKLIRDDGIDILIDLSGHTGRQPPAHVRLEASTGAGHLAGLFCHHGVAAIDYLIADPWTLPESEEANFTETHLAPAGNPPVLHTARM